MIATIYVSWRKPELLRNRKVTIGLLIFIAIGATGWITSISEITDCRAYNCGENFICAKPIELGMKITTGECTSEFPEEVDYSCVNESNTCVKTNQQMIGGTPLILASPPGHYALPMYTLAAYVIVMLIGRFISQSQRNTKHSLIFQSRAITKDWTALLTALSAALAIGLPIFEATLRENSYLEYLHVLAGLVIILMGYGVAYAANRAIGKNWSPIIDKTKEQNLVTTGMYSIIRHPLYLSSLLILAGSNIYFKSSWAWVGTLLALIVILIRLPIEERRLVERFGQEYIAYQNRTRAILPWIL